VQRTNIGFKAVNLALRAAFLSGLRLYESRLRCQWAAYRSFPAPSDLYENFVIAGGQR